MFKKINEDQAKARESMLKTLENYMACVVKLGGSIEMLRQRRLVTSSRNSHIMAAHMAVGTEITCLMEDYQAKLRQYAVPTTSIAGVKERADYVRSVYNEVCKISSKIDSLGDEVCKISGIGQYTHS